MRTNRQEEVRQSARTWLVACAAALSTDVALAQEAAAPEELATIPVAQPAGGPAPAATADAEPPQQIEEVIVTSTKRAKSLRDIPASITAFDGDKLEEQGKIGLADYLEQSPGVTQNTSSPGFLRISMRGISTDSNPLSSIPSPTGILIGDVAFSDPYFSNIVPDLSAFDLSSVEVLKGPQGTLFGGAALAGAIRYVLHDPVLGEWEGSAFSQYARPDGGTSAFTEGVSLNVPVYTDALALRLDYVRREYPGVYDLPNLDQKNVEKGGGNQYRAIALWQPIDELKAKFTYLSQDYDADNSSAYGDQRHKRENSLTLLPSATDQDFSLESLELGYDFSGARLVSVSSHNEKNLTLLNDSTAGANGAPPPGTPTQAGIFLLVHDNSESYAQEIRLQSTGHDGFQWLVGAYYVDYKVHVDILGDTVASQLALGNGGLVEQLLSGANVDSADLFQQTSVIYGVTDTKSSERALFFDLNDVFFDHLELSAGARLYSTLVTGGFVGEGVLARAENNGMNIDATGNRLRQKGISPKLAAIWHFDRDLSAYVQASRGFRFGGVQSVPSSPTNGVPATYKSDTLWNYEGGFRTSWFERTLQIDITGFYIDYQNPQIGQTTSGVPLGYTTNVSHAISQGFEANIRWLTPLRGLNLGQSGGYTDSHITKRFTAADGTVVQPGSTLPGASKFQTTSSIDYLHRVGDILLGTHVDYTYVGAGYSDITHTQKINNFGTLGGGVSIGSDAWALKPQLTFNVSNILDTTGIKGGSTGKALAGTPYEIIYFNQPRTYTARVGLKF